MKNQLAAYVDNTITLLLLATAGITPLLFLNQTTEFYEIPKLIFLITITAIIILLWTFSWVIKGKVVITRTPLDIPLLILLVVVIISTYFSGSKYPAIYGNFPKVHGSAVAWVTYILLYFVTVSHLKNLIQVRSFLYVLYLSALAVAIVSLLAFFKLFLPFEFTQSVNFTPTGSTFSTLAFLSLLLPLPLLSILYKNKYFPAPLAVTVATLFMVTIVLLGNFLVYLLLIGVVGICLYLVKSPKPKNTTLALYAIPSLVAGAVLAMAYIPFSGNPLQVMEANFPKEIQLPIQDSWKITASSFRDSPLWGSGPSNFLFDFTNFKPTGFNSYPYWNFSFDTAYNEFLQIFSTLGLLGLLSLIVLSAVVLINGVKNLSLKAADATASNMNLFLPALAISGIISLILLLIHASTLVSIVVTLFILAAFMATLKSIKGKVFEFSMGIKAASSENTQFDLLPLIIFILVAVAIVPVMYKTYQAAAADYYHRQALSQANQNGTLTYQFLQKAESLNPVIDLYRVDMAQTNFALANAIAAQKGPSEASPTGSLTDQDKQTIQTLISQAINEGRASVALSPRSSRNWEVLASVYRNITGIAENSLVYSLDAYGNAIKIDPLNPQLRVNVGGIYYAAKNYDMAVRFFNDAANLKPDYANAYFNLSIALKDKGDMQNAILAAERVAALLENDKNSPAYKQATDYLTSLKSPGTSTAQAPAAQTDSALENNVAGVNITDLGATSEATPEAIQSNPEANIPSATPAAPVATPAPQ
jgi:O-antigen ligase